MTTRATATAEIQRAVDLVHDELVRFPWAHRMAYGNLLAQTYYYVRQVSRVLAAAAARTPIDQPQLHDHFLHNISEEKEHGVLALNDLRDLDLDLSKFPEHALTTAFYETLLYRIDRAGPPVILGYFFVLEGVAGDKGKDIYKIMNDAYQGRALSFALEHVILDAEHFPQSLKLLDGMSDAELEVVRVNVHYAGALYRSMVRAVRTEAGVP
jgi:hypothetical protein